MLFQSYSKARCAPVHTGTAAVERCLPQHWARKRCQTLLSAVRGFHTGLGGLLSPFALSLLWWTRLAALRSKRKATEPQEGTIYLRLGTNIKLGLIFKNARTVPTDSRAWTRTRERCWGLLVLKALARANAPSFTELLSDPYGQCRHRHTELSGTLWFSSLPAAKASARNKAAWRGKGWRAGDTDRKMSRKRLLGFLTERKCQAITEGRRKAPWLTWLAKLLWISPLGGEN